LRQFLPTTIFSFFVVTLLTLGWQQREEYWLTAEKGWGYSLGIIGGTMMLVLLLYPVRKHWRLARNWFSIRHWFKMHMLFGILGPLLILFHSNFHLGSLNSNIALFSMLLVSGSGLIGRFAYQKIHRGLYGKKIQFSDLKTGFEEGKAYLKESLIISKESLDTIADIELKLNQSRLNLFMALKYDIQISSILRKTKKHSRRVAKQLGRGKDNLEQQQTFINETKQLCSGLMHLKKMTSHSFYANLFSMWHLFHLPIFFLMIIAGFVHVFAVHMY